MKVAGSIALMTGANGSRPRLCQGASENREADGFTSRRTILQYVVGADFLIDGGVTAISPVGA